jgi:hypothetical protein
MFAAADLDCSDRIWKLDLLDDCLETIWTMCSDYTTNNSTLKGEWPGAFSSRRLENWRSKFAAGCERFWGRRMETALTSKYPLACFHLKR